MAQAEHAKVDGDAIALEFEQYKAGQEAHVATIRRNHELQIAELERKLKQ